MEPSYEIFDHTADAGIRARAASLPELLQPATDGLYAVIGELVPGAKPESLRIELAEEDMPILLRDYLAELLVVFERDHRVASEVRVDEFDAGRLQATVTTHTLDRERSVLHREVKAITYHELDIRPIDGGVEATIIVDI